MICRKRPDGMTVGIWNFANDVLLPETVRLDGAYRAIAPIGATEAALDGDTVTLPGEIPPYGFAGFTVTR